MLATAQRNNRTSRRDEFNPASGPTLREIRSSTAAVRGNWSQGERQFRAHMAQLLQQQLLDRVAANPALGTQVFVGSV